MRRFFLGFMILVSSLSASEIYATFNIQASQSANLAFFSGGIIDKVFVDISSEVKKGDKLIELHNDDLKASLRIAKAQLVNAEVSLKYAKKDYERQLQIKDLIDEAKFDEYELVLQKAKVATSQAKANLAYKQSLLDKTAIYAPFDGVIFEKNVEVGDVVSGLMLRTLFKIQSKNMRKLIFEFDQKYWKTVKVGSRVKYKVNGDESSYSGTISKVYPYANSDNRKIKAEVQANGFVVGLFGDGHIIVDDR